ncbi:MAG: sensor domain-containing diguanylate cyclase [Candidatus Manganitrophaceae bacterium]|nr:MAG: sensor domain-containing diguanylate cyclase [Candidatus Manganitrophaceae bacterium]
MDDVSNALQSDHWQGLLQIANHLFQVRRFNEALYHVVREVASRMEVLRCSIIFVDDRKEIAYVVATHETSEIKRIPLDLKKYPEIVQAVHAKEPVFIPNVSQDVMMAPFQGVFRQISLQSVLVHPLIQGEKVLGNLILKISSPRVLTHQELQFVVWVSRLASSAIRNAHHYETLLEERDQLERLAMIDFLTDTYNHRYFNARLEEEFNRAIRYNLSLSAILLDIDDFKWVNDTYGHRRGDTILREVASVIKGTIRKTDFLARYGGEEFVILLPQTDLAGAYQEGERIRQAVRNHSYGETNQTKRITLSLGVATFPGRKITTTDDLIRAADTALYQAKRLGKDRIEAFAPSE